MHTIERARLLQRWTQTQGEILPQLAREVGALTPKLERLVHTLEWIRIEEFVTQSWCGVGRPPHERAWLANAFVAKVVLNLPTSPSHRNRHDDNQSLRTIPCYDSNVPYASRGLGKYCLDWMKNHGCTTVIV